LDDCRFDLPSWDCTRLRCGTYAAPANAKVVTPRDWNSGSQLTCGTTQLLVACDDGFVRKGSPPGTRETSFHVTCNNDRKIINLAETCVRPFCAPVDNPYFVDVGLTSNAVAFSPRGGLHPESPGSAVTITCGEGYRGVNVLDATCTDQQTFQAVCTDACMYDSSAYSCVKVVCSLNNVPNLVFDRNSMSPFFPYQSSFPASCQEGYRVGSNDHTSPLIGNLFCGPDCGFVPGCLPVSCGMYLPPINAKLLGSADAREVFFGTAAVQCDEGFIIEGAVAPACANTFTIMCGDDGTVRWQGTGRCTPRICDCPGAGECVTTRISCGQYSVLPTSDVLPEAAWTPNRDYAFGDKIQLRCKQGYSVRINFPGINRAGGACQKFFVDECLSIGLFRTSFEEACQRIQCPAPAMTGLVKVPASDPVSYGTVVSQTCLTGYEAINVAGAYVTSLPYESICQDTCDMSHPLTCIYSECGLYADFDYSEGVEPVEPITKYGDQLQITCKPDFMLDDRLPCTTAQQTAADNCIPIRYHLNKSASLSEVSFRIFTSLFVHLRLF